MKNTFGFTILLLFNLQCCWQVLRTSTDLEQQFSATFKHGNSWQVQTCYKPMVQRQRKTATFSSLLWYRRNRSFNDLEPLRINTTMLAALHAQAFSLGDAKLLHFVLTEWNTTVITMVLFWDISKCNQFLLQLLFSNCLFTHCTIVCWYLWDYICENDMKLSIS